MEHNKLFTNSKLKTFILLILLFNFDLFHPILKDRYKNIYY